MNELQKILSDSTASAEVKQRALTLAMEISTPIAFSATANQAGGEFMTLLVELIKLLLPLLLKLLNPV